MPRRGIVLVIEDRDDVRLGLAELLELNGFRVADAATAEQAIASLRAQPAAYALVLLDLMLPGTMSGIDLRARQLADPTLAAIPTVVLSASDQSSGVRADLKPAAWLEKPFYCDDLMQVVRQYVVPEEHHPTG
jgi:CheY-like chemotaxis protein